MRIKNVLAWPYTSLLIAVFGTILSNIITSRVNYDNNPHGIFLISIFIALAGLIIAIVNTIKTHGRLKAFPIIGIIANLLLLLWTFFVYSFSYWQF
jgi:uncharacterized membrane protein YidH (DUF202 family)